MVTTDPEDERLISVFLNQDFEVSIREIQACNPATSADEEQESAAFLHVVTFSLNDLPTVIKELQEIEIQA